MTMPTRRRSEASSETGSSVRVLIVDDEENCRAWFTHLCRRLGLETVTAADGDEALELLRGGGFDLLLSDYEMPKRDGLQLIEAVRGEAIGNGIYAVMLTGHDEADLKVRAFSAGFDDFLSKGCTEVEVVARVAAARRLLARSRSLARSVREWQEIANRDELTGVATRRLFFDEAQRLLAAGRPFAVLLFDLDDFKQVNDRFGHLAGDGILRDLGHLLLESTRVDDLVARFGGDEFVLLAADVTADEADALAERLRAAVSSVRWQLGEETLQITACVGRALSSLLEIPSVDQVIDVADHDLYARKWLRKNPSSTPEDVYRYATLETPGTIVQLPEPPSAKVEPTPAPDPLRLPEASS